MTSRTADCVIIIPVYNNFSEVLTCVESVLRHTPKFAQLMLLDDASPEGILSNYLPRSIRNNPKIVISRNESNLGFVATCNKGMSQSAPHDVLLLNSDTEVTAGWLEKLSAAAYSRPEVGTVCPLTNNGTICSVPRFCQDNQIPDGYTLTQFSSLIEEVSAKEYPELPTAVGFCMYIKREVLQKIGLFDADAFGLGYGEENDFCCRAQKAGFVDILDDATFVYHKGNVSFQTKKSDLSARNSEILRKRYPHYFDNVATFCREFPLRQIHARILDEMVRSWHAKASKRVLHVLHNGPFVPRHHDLGGTELHVQDLIINGDNSIAFWSLVPGEKCMYLTAHMGAVDREYILDQETTSLAELLSNQHFDLVHLHHTKGFVYHLLYQGLIANGSYFVSLHDYYLICPRVNLLTPERRHCSLNECTSACSVNADYIREYRYLTGLLLAQAKKIICFSESTGRYMAKVLGSELRFEISPHGIHSVRKSPRQSASKPEQRALKVLFLGFIPHHKGSLLIEQIVNSRELQSGSSVEWHVLGEVFQKLPKHVTQHGKYHRQDLLQKLDLISPDLVAILSICPETYCLTLDEAWNANIPVVVTPLGAPAERVSKVGAGWVLPDISVNTFLRQLDRIATDWEDYLQRKDLTKNAALLSVESEANNYSEWYKSGARRSLAHDSAILLRYLKGFVLDKPPSIPFLRKVFRFCLNRTIYFLDFLKIRVLIERIAYALIPQRLINDLKSLR